MSAFFSANITSGSFVSYAISFLIFFLAGIPFPFTVLWNVGEIVREIILSLLFVIVNL